MKTCNECKIEKEVTEYHPKKRGKDGLQAVCRICVLKKAAVYRENNREAYNARSKKWASENKEYRSVEAKKYHIANRETLNAKNKKYRDANKEAVSARGKKYRQTEAGQINGRKKLQARRARKLNSAALYNEQEAEIFAEMTRQALALTESTGEVHHIDHIVPLAHPLASGLHYSANWQVVPASWNIAKGNRSMEVYGDE